MFACVFTCMYVMCCLAGVINDDDDDEYFHTSHLPRERTYLPILPSLTNNELMSHSSSGVKVGYVVQ